MDAWTELPAWLRMTIALIVLGLGAVIFWFVSWRLGMGVAILGFVMFVVGGKSDAEKNGYRF